VNRFYGAVGYGQSVESPAGSGVWEEIITEYNYMGDLVRTSRRLEQGEGLNSDISVGNSISVVADPYAVANFLHIKYVEWNGVRWTVSSVEIKERRLIMELGEVYNGPTPDPPDTP
jgi:hypothetical protein